MKVFCAPVAQRGDQDALEHLVRAALDQDAVLERARLRFVGVADEVLRLASPFVGMNDHLRPVEKPAPPRPWSPESFTSWITSAGAISVSALRAAR